MLNTTQRWARLHPEPSPRILASMSITKIHLQQSRQASATSILRVQNTTGSTVMAHGLDYRFKDTFSRSRLPQQAPAAHSAQRCGCASTFTRIRTNKGHYNSVVDDASAAAPAGSELCSFSNSSGTISIAFSCVLSSTTRGAFPARCACSHRDEHRHLCFIGVPNQGEGVMYAKIGQLLCPLETIRLYSPRHRSV